MKQITLASASPRRLSILKENGFAPVVILAEVDEDLSPNLSLDSQMMELAKRKAWAATESSQFETQKEQIVISADTLVVLDGLALGKPKSENEARDFLKRLSGRSHQVKTAICLLDWPSQKMVLDIGTTEVVFRTLTDDEITNYIQTGEPMDKAGAYGIQGLGGKFVENTVGSFDNVVGLPIELVKRHLENRGWL